MMALDVPRETLSTGKRGESKLKSCQIAWKITTKRQEFTFIVSCFRQLSSSFGEAKSSTTNGVSTVHGWPDLILLIYFNWIDDGFAATTFVNVAFLA
jgi:hypothetical protein